MARTQLPYKVKIDSKTVAQFEEGLDALIFCKAIYLRESGEITIAYDNKTTVFCATNKSMYEWDMDRLHGANLEVALRVVEYWNSKKVSA